MPTREDAEKLRQDTERLRSARLERERLQAEEDKKAEKKERESLTRERNNLNLAQVHTTARRLDELNVRILWRRARLENWEERNIRFHDTGAWETVGHLAGVAGLAGCIVADTIILSTPSRLLSRGFRESMHLTTDGYAWTVPAAAFIFSVSYFAAEFCIGYQRTGIRRSAIGPIDDRAFAIIAWVTLPVLTFVYTLINTGLLSNDPFKLVGPASIAGGITASLALGAVALVVHGFVLYYSDAIALGFAFIYYKIGQLILRFMINRTVRQINRLAGQTEDGFRRFVDHYRSTNNGNGTDPGPFSGTATRVVNDLFGSEVIETPSKRGHNRGEQNNEGGITATGGGPEPGIERSEHDDQDVQADRADAESRDDQAGPDGPGRGFDWDGEDEVRG